MRKLASGKATRGMCCTAIHRVQTFESLEIGESIADQLGPHNAELKYFRDCRQVSVDYKKFKLFELSILWRVFEKNHGAKT